MDQPINVIFIGRSGCGKGTQADLLKKYLEDKTGLAAKHFSTGEKIYGLVGTPSLVGRLIGEKVRKYGKLAPRSLAIWAWSDFLNNTTGEEHIILDGTPRTLVEADLLDEALAFFDREKVYAVWLDTSVEEIKERLLKRGRADDTGEGIKNRLAFYEKDVVPVIDYFKNESKIELVHVDGNPRDPNLIHKNILAALGLQS